jgi:hypothetical protein
MDQLIELLKQIQDLAGVAIDALEGSSGKEKGQPGDESKPGGEPPAESAAEGGGGAPPGGGAPGRQY